MGFDELRPLSQAGVDTLGGLGATVVDALDTLWMLGLKDEINRARDWVASKLSFDRWQSLLCRSAGFVKDTQSMSTHVMRTSSTTQ